VKNIPTAEQIANKWALDDGDLLHDAAIEAMKEYANLHREAALKAAAKMATFTHRTSDGLRFVASKESILNAYPKELIQ
jgi:hypothetical protein